MAIIGLALATGGGYLVAVGGSRFFLLMGLAMTLAAVLILCRQPAGAWLYGLAFLLTLCWAVWEVGLSFWPLFSRLFMFGALALLVTLAYPQLGAAKAAPAGCARRLFLPTIDARLIALDADTGQPCADFGDGGSVDLTTDMGEVKPGYYQQTSAPLVAGDRVVVGGRVADNFATGEPPGVVRAFDVHSGALYGPGIQGIRPLPARRRRGRSTRAARPTSGRPCPLTPSSI